LRVAADHLLSYFLGANDGTNDNSNPESQISITVDPTSVRRSFQSSGIAGNPGIAAMDSMLENFVSARAKESSDGLTNATSTSTYAPSMGAESPARSVHFDDGNLRLPLANQQMFRPSASDNTLSAYDAQGFVHIKYSKPWFSLVIAHFHGVRPSIGGTQSSHVHAAKTPNS